MNGKCCEPGTIQSFIDGELTPARSSEVTNHIAGCDACAAVLARAEEEISIVFPALERELDTLVPTHRLWARINEGIVEERRSAPYWRRFWTAVMVQIANPSIAAAAGVLIIFALFAGVWSLRSTRPGDVAINEKQPKYEKPILQASPVIVDPVITTTVDEAPPVQRKSQATAVRVSDSVERHDPRINHQPAPALNNAVYLPGEESYVKTIANLSQAVDGQKDMALRPSARVSYEKDMAVVDDAISRMKKEVRNNPRNESAKQVLYSSYQNKIDLLNSVAQKEELMASLK